MCRLLLTLFACVVLAAPARTADDPRALIRQAIKAMGGEKELTRPLAVKRKIRGNLRGQGDPKGIGIEGEFLTQAGGTPLRYTVELTLFGTKANLVIVLAGDKSWKSVNKTVQPILAEEKNSIQSTSHAERVMGMVDLLKDKGFSFRTLDEIKIDSKSARGIKVSYKGQPDVELYFDKVSGLPVKVRYRIKPAAGAKEVLHEILLRDYRPADAGAAEEQILKGAKIATDGPNLLAFLRRQAPDPGKRDKVRDLVKQLGDDSFQVRQKAEADLIVLGKVALPLLKEALKSKDLEVVRRARRCLRAIGTDTNHTTINAVVRLLAWRRPVGASEALLDYLPGADPEVAEEIRAALVALSEHDGKPNPVLLKALKDSDPIRRAAAQAVLGKDGGVYLKKPGRRLFLRSVKQPRKTLSSTDGKESMELEVVEVHYFNRFEDREFARP
jgi:hypothetical protein